MVDLDTWSHHPNKHQNKHVTSMKMMREIKSLKLGSLKITKNAKNNCPMCYSGKDNIVTNMKSISNIGLDNHKVKHVTNQSTIQSGI